MHALDKQHVKHTHLVSTFLRRVRSLCNMTIGTELCKMIGETNIYCIMHVLRVWWQRCVADFGIICSFIGYRQDVGNCWTWSTITGGFVGTSRRTLSRSEAWQTASYLLFESNICYMFEPTEIAITESKRSNKLKPSQKLPDFRVC